MVPKLTQVVIGCLILAYCSVSFMGAARAVDETEQGQEDWKAVESRRLADSQKVAATLRNTTHWDDPATADDVAALIRMAGVLRSEESIEPLVDHILFNPAVVAGRRGTAALPAEARYPAVKALASIGLPAIPTLIAKIKQQGEDDRSKAQIGMVVRTIRLICLEATAASEPDKSRGAKATSLARTIIELELREVRGDERERLKESLRMLAEI